MKNNPTWTLANTYEEYRDFELHRPVNAHGIGGTICITLIDRSGEEPSAYGAILWNSDEDLEIGPPSKFSLTRLQAELLACPTE